MRGLLLLLNALLLLESTDGNKEYHQLSQYDTRIVDKAIQLANTDKDIQQANERAKHLDFALILQANYEKRMLHVILKSTSCDKTTENIHQKDCIVQEKGRPQVSCVDCRGNMSCSLLKETEKIKRTISECLNPPSERTHQTGEAHPMFSKSEKEQQTGCLGCI